LQLVEVVEFESLNQEFDVDFDEFVVGFCQKIVVASDFVAEEYLRLEVGLNKTLDDVVVRIQP